MRMNTYFFQIADILFQLQIDHEVIVNRHFKPFQLKCAEADCCIEIIPEGEIDFLQGDMLQRKRLFSAVGFDVFSEGNHFVRQYVEQDMDRQPYAQGRISSDGKKVIVRYLPDFAYAFSEVTNSFSHIGFDELLIHHNRMILHASLLETEYGGILFVGPSGVGKSTQAKLWEQNNKGEIINGDRPILGKVSGVWYGWGSPYAGSSIYHKAQKISVSAIVFLKQGKDNHMEKILPSGAFRNLYMHTTNNLWNRECVNKVIDMIHILSNEIAAYELTCTPDKEAVGVVENCLKGGLSDGSKRNNA